MAKQRVKSKAPPRVPKAKYYGIPKQHRAPPQTPDAILAFMSSFHTTAEAVSAAGCSAKIARKLRKGDYQGILQETLDHISLNMRWYGVDTLGNRVDRVLSNINVGPQFVRRIQRAAIIVDENRDVMKVTGCLRNHEFAPQEQLMQLCKAIADMEKLLRDIHKERPQYDSMLMPGTRLPDLFDGKLEAQQKVTAYDDDAERLYGLCTRRIYIRCYNKKLRKHLEQMEITNEAEPL